MMDKLYVTIVLGVIAILLLPSNIKLPATIALIIIVIALSRNDNPEKAFQKAISLIDNLIAKYIPDKYQIVDVYPLFHTIILDIKPDGDRIIYRIVLYRIGRRWSFVSTPMNLPFGLERALINIIRELGK